MVNEKVLVSKDLLNELGNKFKKLTGENKKFTIQEMIDAKVIGGVMPVVEGNTLVLQGGNVEVENKTLHL